MLEKWWRRTRVESGDPKAIDSTEMGQKVTQSTELIDVSEHPDASEARRRMEEVIKQDLSAEQIAQNLHFIIGCTDRKDVNVKVNLKGVRALVARLRSLGYTGDASSFQMYQDSRHTSPYSATDAVNSFRSHCESIVGKMPIDAKDDSPVDLLRSEVILEYKNR